MAELNHSRLLIDEPPLQVLPSLAMALGLNEAIVLQQVQYWIVRKGHDKQGHRWIYNSIPSWQKQFPFWSESTIKRTFAGLEELGILVSGNFNETAYDRTKWYRIEYGRLSGLPALAERSGGEWDDPSIDAKRPEPSGQVDQMEPVNLHPPIPRDYQENNQETNNPPTPLTNPAFESFWTAFPGRRKVDKRKCETWWRNHINSKEINAVMAGLESWKSSPDWKKNGGEFVPMPYTWLNNRRWEAVEVLDPEPDPTKDEWGDPIRELDPEGWEEHNRKRFLGIS